MRLICVEELFFPQSNGQEVDPQITVSSLFFPSPTALSVCLRSCGRRSIILFGIVAPPPRGIKLETILTLVASSSICSLVYPSVDDDIDCLGKEPAAFRFPIPTTEATRRDSLIHSLTDGDSNVTVKRREGKPLLIKTARRASGTRRGRTHFRQETASGVARATGQRHERRGVGETAQLRRFLRAGFRFSK